MGNIEVIGLGALNIDRMCRVEHIITEGEAVVSESIRPRSTDAR